MTTQGNRLPDFPAAYFEADGRGQLYFAPAFVAKQQVLPWADRLSDDGLSVTQLRLYFDYYCDIRQHIQHDDKSWEQVRRGFDRIYEQLRNARGEGIQGGFQSFVRGNVERVRRADDKNRAFLEGFLPSFEALIGYFRSAEELKQWRDYDAASPTGYFGTDKDNRHYLLPELVARDKVGALAEELASQQSDRTVGQLRRFFNHCRQIEQRLQEGGVSWEQVAASFEMLRCYAYDARKKGKIPARFHAFIDGNVELVNQASNSELAFRKGFMPHYEALVSYFAGKNVEDRGVLGWDGRKSPAQLAEELANAQPKLTKGQLRRFFDHCRVIEHRLKAEDESWERVSASFEMLCAYAQDARPKDKQEKIPAEFQSFIEDGVRWVNGSGDRKKFFLESFVPYFEALVGFSESV